MPRRACLSIVTGIKTRPRQISGGYHLREGFVEIRWVPNPLWVSLALCLPLVGCGSAEYGSVEGRITLDGQPLEGGFVQFFPEAPGGGTVAYGKTDAGGHYQMAISDAHAGILPGTYRVEITTAEVAVDDNARPYMIRERIPVKYNKKSELTGKTVVAGETQRFDFDLESSGRIIQPKPDGG